MGDLYKRGKVWWGRYAAPGGLTQRISLKTADKKAALQALRRIELAGGPDRPQDRTVSVALAHLLDTVYAGRNPKTVESYRQKARHLVRLLGAGTSVSHVTRAACQEYRATRLKEGASEHSVYKEAVVLRLALAESGIEGVVPKFSANYKPVERHLSIEQFGALLAALPVDRRLWVVLAAMLGGRDSEVIGLRWEDVDLEAGLVRIRGTKTASSDRVAHIPPPVAALLAAAAPDPKTGLVVSKWTNRRRDMTAAYWKVIGWEPPKKWHLGAKKSASIKGAPRLSPNDLRRTFASWLKQQSVDSLVVAHMLGHTTSRMVETVYGRLASEQYARASRQLPAIPECVRFVPETRHNESTPVHSRPLGRKAKNDGSGDKPRKDRNK
jgi:integrase